MTSLCAHADVFRFFYMYYWVQVLHGQAMRAYDQYEHPPLVEAIHSTVRQIAEKNAYQDAKVLQAMEKLPNPAIMFLEITVTMLCSIEPMRSFIETLY